MNESGGEKVFVGSAKPEVRSQNIVEYVKTKWKRNIEENMRTLGERTAQKADNKAVGRTVEKTFIEAFDKTIGALDEGKLKKVASRLRFFARAEAKIARVGLATVDIIVAAIPAIAGYTLYRKGINAVASELVGGKRFSAGQVLMALGLGSSGIALGTGIYNLAPSRRANMWFVEKGGDLGERAAKWTNKILARGSTKEPAPSE